MTNFIVRFLYEIFFEIVLCLMINVSFLDYESSSQVANWLLCIAFVVVALASLVAISLLFWIGGPDLKDSYEKRTLLQSFWGRRPMNHDHTELKSLKSSIQDEKVLVKPKNGPKKKTTEVVTVDDFIGESREVATERLLPDDQLMTVRDIGIFQPDSIESCYRFRQESDSALDSDSKLSNPFSNTRGHEKSLQKLNQIFIEDSQVNIEGNNSHSAELSQTYTKKEDLH